MRAEATPRAPSSMASRTCPTISSSSSSVGARSANPKTLTRGVAEPMKEDTFGETPRASRYSRYSPRVVHSISYLMSPCWLSAHSFNESAMGPMEFPSPMTSRVTPWRMSLMARPSSMMVSVAQLMRFTNPGETAIPPAEIS